MYVHLRVLQNSNKVKIDILICILVLEPVHTSVKCKRLFV